MQVENSVTIMRPRSEVYQFWHHLENLPRFMQHLKEVDVLDAKRSHWVARAPVGGDVEWDAEIVQEVPNESISWRSVGDSDVQNAGTVRFTDGPADRGTQVSVTLTYDVPGGKAGQMVAKLLGEEPSQTVRDDMRRLKQVLETGEVVRSDGSMGGAGQGVTNQTPAQPRGRRP